MTRILVINPNTNAPMTEAIGAVAKGAAAPNTEITCVSPEGGPESIEGHVDEVLAAYHVVEVVAGTRGNYDGYVIACYGDPALEACREIADVPVVGIAEASFHFASLVARTWSIITVIDRAIPIISDAVSSRGFAQHCASIRSTPQSVLEIEEDLDLALTKVEDEAKKAIEHDAAEAILLGCAGFGPIEARIEAAVGVPVFDGTGCAVKLVEAMLGKNVTTSKKRSYRTPEPKKVTNCGPNITNFYRSL